MELLVNIFRLFGIFTLTMYIVYNGKTGTVGLFVIYCPQKYFIQYLIFFFFQHVLHCPVCRYSYSESKTKTPRLLQCGHTMCHECLQHMIKEAVVKCPICRCATPVPRNKVENLKKNFALFDAFNEHEVGISVTSSLYEPPRGKTNNVVSEQVRHKPACTSTEKS